MKHNITFAPGAFEAYKEWAIIDKKKFFILNLEFKKNIIELLFRKKEKKF